MRRDEKNNRANEEEKIRKFRLTYIKWVDKDFLLLINDDEGTPKGIAISQLFSKGAL
jgi:hypothetical protein